MDQSPILVLGDVNVDLIIPIREKNAVPAASGENSLELQGGGTAGNTAVALARLGHLTSFIGSVGDDSYGRWAAQDLKSEGVDIRYLNRVRDAHTSMVMAVIHQDGERDLFVWPDSGGAHTRLTPENINREMIEGAAWLHTTGLCLREELTRSAQLKAMGLAKDLGIPVSLDLNLRMESWGLEKEIRDVFQKAINLSAVILGSGADEMVPFAGESDIEDAARAISAGKRTVIARLGGAGALVVEPQSVFSVPAYQVDVVDTLGAGDAFNGGFISARLEGLDLHGCVKRGHAVAALKLGRKGARGLPDRQDVMDFLYDS
jgi:sugar/nucleoside kinase (ribokinase family)